MRLFVAINLPRPIRENLALDMNRLRQIAPSVRWIRPDNLHITVRFLGTVAPARVEDITRGLGNAVRERNGFRIAIHGLGAFPSLKNPRVLWSGIRPNHQLTELQRAVEREMQNIGFPGEARPFHPHVTLARVDRPLPEAEAAALRADSMCAEMNVDVATIDLMESRSTTSGAEYTLIRTVPLGTSEV